MSDYRIMAKGSFSREIMVNDKKAKEISMGLKTMLKKINVYTGIYGADMKVSITNDGPVTIILESRK